MAERETSTQRGSITATRQLSRGLFLWCAIRIAPQILSALEAVLPTYRRIISALPSGLDQKRTSILARKLGFDDDVAFLESDKEPVVRYPEVLWRDPRPNLKLGEKAPKNRLARGLTIKEEAERRGILPRELEEWERGCKQDLTITTGAEPLRSALRWWAARCHLSGNWYFSDFCFNWALEQLRNLAAA